MDDNSDKWVPPTDAEVKVIQARRERSDKISKIMSEYLLKGYKMLGSVCDDCETVLLQDRQQKLYCVACSEVDTEHAKDNPARSGSAARRQIEESQFTGSTEESSSSPRQQRQSTNRERGGESSVSNSLTANNGPHARRNDESSGNRPKITDDSVTHALQVVQEKMIWTSKKLSKNTSLDGSLQLCQLLKACAETYVALKEAQQTK